MARNVTAKRKAKQSRRQARKVPPLLGRRTPRRFKAVAIRRAVADAADAVARAGKPAVVLPNYTAMLTVRDKLSTLAGKGRFWE